MSQSSNPAGAIGWWKLLTDGPPGLGPRDVGGSRPAERATDADRELTAFADRHAEAARAVFRYAWMLVGDEALAEDITVDVFREVWRGRRRSREDSLSLAALMAMARRRVRSLEESGRDS